MKPTKHVPRKFVVRRQILRVLSPRQLTDIVGGVPEQTIFDSVDGHCTLSNAINCAQ